MTYKLYSQTTSGWRISEDPDAPKDKRWRAEHDDFSTLWGPEHRPLVDQAMSVAFDAMRKILKEKFR
jgi:hypothetical protein